MASLLLLLCPALLCAQTPARSAGGDDQTKDTLQHSVRIDNYTLVGSKGEDRGETIYYFKCWMCHNKYTKSAPYLKDLFQRETLSSGDPVDEQTVAAKIKDGGSRMPAFQYSLTDTDISDLMVYLHSGKCCVEGENPPANPWYRASEANWTVPRTTSGGASGSVKLTDGGSPEGVMVQLIAPNGVRTTVYTDEDGRYQFPQMQPGSYTLRIATPLEFRPYQRPVTLKSSSPHMDDIALTTRAKSEYLEPTQEIESELSGAEIMWNLPGTAREKDAVRRQCGPACHSYQQIFRVRFDERSWRLIVDRMLHYSSATLINRSRSAGNDLTPEVEETIVKWLSKVRGPDAKDEPLRFFPRPQGASTKVVVTEYELPRLLISPHDVSGDPGGNIWYTSHKSRFVGRLDPETGIVKEYALPLTDGVMPGTHRVIADKNGIIWFSENWAKKLTRLDPQTGEITQVQVESAAPLNSSGFGNFALAPDGSVWISGDHNVNKIDPKTGKIVKRYPLPVSGTYDSLISSDGAFWAGGSPGGSYGNDAHLLNIRTGEMANLDTGPRLSSARRGGFDPAGNAWFGGGGGSLVEIEAKTHRIREYWPPTPYVPYTDFYEAMPDKNGEVWGGELHGRGFVRFNPASGRWIEYVLPEPFGYDRRTWIDNSTNPVTVWYVDYSTECIVRIQPLH